MIEPNDNYTDDQSYESGLGGYDFVEEESNADGEFGFDEVDIIEDIDFSEIRGKDFKSSLSKVNKAYAKKKAIAKKPLSKDFVVKKRATLYGKNDGGGTASTTKRIIVPDTQKVIIQGVDKFILGNDDKCGAKDIGYYKCKKLKELVFTMDNNSAVDFNLELFNPSMPLDYLFSTSGNLNNKIQVAGGVVSYSDVLFNFLANPPHIVNAKFTFAGSSFINQINQPLIFTNKSATGEQKVEPFQLQLEVDNMQVAKDIVFFKLDALNRPFIPNGMDVIQYKVLAGNTVTFAFYYRQKDIRKFYYEEARNSKKLL
ncbi:MAG: hypothetical protein WCJ62_12465 [Flavobacterium sp.]